MLYYNIKVQFEKKTLRFSRSENQDIISASNINWIDFPNSFCSAIFSSCSSKGLEGPLDQEDTMGLNDDLKEKGFELFCLIHPKSDLIIVKRDQVEDDLYNDQFGKY